MIWSLFDLVGNPALRQDFQGIALHGREAVLSLSEETILSDYMGRQDEPKMVKNVDVAGLQESVGCVESDCMRSRTVLIHNKHTSMLRLGTPLSKILPTWERLHYGDTNTDEICQACIITLPEFDSERHKLWEGIPECFGYTGGWDPLRNDISGM